MQGVLRRRLPWLALCWMGICLGTGVAGPAVGADLPKPLAAAHAHNDYWHQRPLLDALDHGFCNVEADVFLHDSKLLVGHDAGELESTKTLEVLYLKPLAQRVRENGGSVFPQASRFFLLVDVKSEAKSTYAAIDRLLANYSDILTPIENGDGRTGAITVVISGNRDQETIRQQVKRYAGIDGRASDLENEEPSHVMPWISDNWNNHFPWTGDGPMPADQKEKLREYVKKAHRHGRLVRFWATPENERVWEELLAADVDLIGSDDLERLQRFLLKQSSPKD